MNRNTEFLQGRYRVLNRIGKGGFSNIYQALDVQTGQEVSIKEFTADHMDGVDTVLRSSAYDIARQSVPSPRGEKSSLSQEEMLVRGLMQVVKEEEMLKRLADVPGVPAVYGTFRENDTIYLVREYLEGMTCRDYMDRFRGRIPFTLGLYIMKGILEILDAAHKRGYIHCDVSTINSFLCRDGTVCLIDWGNAVKSEGSMEDHVVRQAVNVRFSAPEQQISGERLTPATDIYCLCAVIYDAVCGDAPRQCLKRLKEGRDLVDPSFYVSDLPDFVSRMLVRGLSLDPADRPGCAELLEILDRETAFSVTPVAGTGNVQVSARLLNEKRSPFGFLTSRRYRRPTVL